MCRISSFGSCFVTWLLCSHCWWGRVVVVMGGVIEVVVGGGEARSEGGGGWWWWWWCETVLATTCGYALSCTAARVYVIKLEPCTYKTLWCNG